MNSENIKALIELFGNLGASSKEAFLWYIGFQAFQNLLIFVMVGVAVTLIYKLIRKNIGSDNAVRAMIKLRDRANLGTYTLTDGEIIETQNHYLKIKDENLDLYRDNMKLNEENAKLESKLRYAGVK